MIGPPPSSPLFPSPPLSRSECRTPLACRLGPRPPLRRRVRVRRAVDGDLLPAVVREQKAASCASGVLPDADRKSTRLNSSHSQISYAVFCLKKKKKRADHVSHPKLPVDVPVRLVSLRRA